MSWLLWVVASLLLSVLELATVDFTFLMLACAALVAALISALGLNLTWQVITFAVAAVLLLFLVRPRARAHVLRKLPNQATNVDALVGKSARVLSEVNSQAGLVKLAGEEWSARSQSKDSVFLPGQMVRVVRVEGARVIVEPLPDEQ